MRVLNNHPTTNNRRQRPNIITLGSVTTLLVVSFVSAIGNSGQAMPRPTSANASAGSSAYEKTPSLTASTPGANNSNSNGAFNGMDDNTTTITIDGNTTTYKGDVNYNQSTNNKDNDNQSNVNVQVRTRHSQSSTSTNVTSNSTYSENSYSKTSSGPLP